MIEPRVATKYATALFRTAKRTDQIKSILDDLLALSDLLKSTPSLKEFLESPQVLEKDKKELFRSTFEPVISQALFSFLLLVLSKHRIGYLLPMTQEFQRLVKEDQGIVQARLVTARAVDRSLVDQIRREMEKSTGKKVEMKLQTEPYLIGGIVIILGDKIIDRSIRHQLSQMKEQMSEVKVY
jgi:F-type H+-transporting ATPase subunit delta